MFELSPSGGEIFCSSRCGNLHLEFTRNVELDWNVFSVSNCVFDVNVAQVISLTLKVFQVPAGGKEY